MRRKTIWIAGACVLLSVLLGGCCWGLGSYWPGLLFWGYAIVALMYFLIILPVNLWLYRQRSPLDPLALETEFILSEARSSAFQLVRFYGTQIVTCLAESLLWPASTAALIVSSVQHGLLKSKAGSAAFLASVSLHPPMMTQSIATAVLVLAVLATNWILPPETGYRRTFMLLIAFAVSCVHILYLIGNDSLLTRLRRSIGNPLVSFVLIGIADVIALVVAFSAFSAWSSQGQVTVAQLRHTATDMLTLAGLRSAVFSGAALTWVDALAGIAGGLYLLNGFKTIIDFRRESFERSTKDLHHIATYQLMLGNYRQARKWLDRVEKPDAMTYELRTGAYLAAGNLKEAENAAKNCVEEKKVLEALRTDEMNRVLVLGVAQYPIAKGLLLQHLQHWLTTITQDLFLHSCLENLLRRQILSAEETLKLYASDEAANQHALSYSTALVFDDNIVRAKEVLRDFAPASSAEEFVRRFLIFRCDWIKFAADATTEVREALSEWEQENVDRLPELAKQCRTDYERLVVVEYASILVDVSRFLVSECVAKWESLEAETTDEIGGEEKVVQTLRVIQNSRSARLRLLQKMTRVSPQS